MFGRRKRELFEQDPAVGPIEELLRVAATRHPAGDWEGRTLHALDVCPCVTYQDAPHWIIYDTPDGVGWRRWPDGLAEPRIVAQASLRAAGHADPAQVLAWLRGEVADPWGGTGDVGGDLEVVSALQRQIMEA